MKRSKFTEAQIAFILRQAEEGTAIGEVCRKAGISEATFYNWRKKFNGLMLSEMKRLRQLDKFRAECLNARWFMCKICYSISRTLSDDAASCDKHIIARPAPSPSSPAHGFGV